jgi:hypothetical protein
VLRQRDEAVSAFFSNLTGAERTTIQVFGEELEDLQIPPAAVYPTRPGSIDIQTFQVADQATVRQALCQLADVPPRTSLPEAAQRYRLLWDLNRWLIARPMSVSHIMAQVRAEVPARAQCPDDALRAEVEAALTLGAALPDGTPGALRLRAHRFI